MTLMVMWLINNEEDEFFFFFENLTLHGHFFHDWNHPYKTKLDNVPTEFSCGHLKVIKIWRVPFQVDVFTFLPVNSSPITDGFHGDVSWDLAWFYSVQDDLEGREFSWKQSCFYVKLAALKWHNVTHRDTQTQNLTEPGNAGRDATFVTVVDYKYCARWTISLVIDVTQKRTCWRRLQLSELK